MVRARAFWNSKGAKDPISTLPSPLCLVRGHQPSLILSSALPFKRSFDIRIIIMSVLLGTSLGAGLVSMLAESHYVTPALALGTGSLGLPKLFGVTPLILTGMSFWCLMHGFLVVGRSRSKFIELAKKDGEKDVEERYGLPNLYAQGTSKHARTFNCIQRSHQHIFETFPYLCIISLVGAVHYPISAGLSCLAYSVGRVALSNGYANSDGDPMGRYASKLAPLMWRGLIASVFISAVSSISFIAGKPIL